MFCRFSKIMLLFIALICVSCSSKYIAGRQARNYIGDLSEKLSSGSYSVIVLERRWPHLSTGSKVDAVIFNPRRSGYEYIRHTEGDHKLKLNARQGQDAVVVTSANSALYEAIIRENKLSPYVVFGEDKEEIIIVYCSPKPCIISCRENKEGDILLEVKERFKHGRCCSLSDKQ
jgi:hypothetical protein